MSDHKQTTIKAIESLGKYCLEKKDYDLAGALAVIVSALKTDRMHELCWDVTQLGINKKYLDEETRIAAIRAGMK